MRIKLLLFFSLSLFIGCSTDPSPTGLWTVTSVMVGQEEMTPNARWMRFNEDSTQQSGNGWLQHSQGTWNYNEYTQQLRIVDLNGFEDTNEPFRVELGQNEMTWIRTEEGEKVVVELERTEQLPMTYGDQLTGLWGLENSKGKGSYFSDSNKAGAYLFFRWDKRFVINTASGRASGIYHVHGHRPQVELISNGNKPERSTWKVHFDNEKITLTRLATDSIITRTFKRIHEFPQ